MTDPSHSSQRGFTPQQQARIAARAAEVERQLAPLAYDPDVEKLPTGDGLRSQEIHALLREYMDAREREAPDQEQHPS